MKGTIRIRSATVVTMSCLSLLVSAWPFAIPLNKYAAFLVYVVNQ